MAYEGWACFAGVEILNSARAAQYGALYGLSVRVTGANDLIASLGDAPYTDPVTDDAPWYDSAVPDSKGFCGFVGLDIAGVESTASSEWTNLIGDGAVSGPLRRGPREIQFKVVAIGADEAALSYGIAWLSSALRGSACSEDDDLVLYAARPARFPELCEGDNDQPDAWPVDRGDQLSRRVFSVKVLQAPKVRARRYLSGRGDPAVGRGGMSPGRPMVAELEFILKAGVPFWYHEPLLVAAAAGGLGKPGTTYYTGTTAGLNPDASIQACLDLQTQADQLCLDDPRPLAGCTTVTPPVPPAPPVDPCYPSGAYVTARRLVFQIPRAVMSDWLEKVPIMTLFTGRTEVRRLVVRWYTNPQERPPSDPLDPCAVCSSFTISYLPPFSTLYYDGRVGSASVACTGNRTASPVLYGPKGELYTWPEFECTTSMLLEVLTDETSPWAPDSEFDVYLCARSDSC